MVMEGYSLTDGVDGDGSYSLTNRGDRGQQVVKEDTR